MKSVTSLLQHVSGSQPFTAAGVECGARSGTAKPLTQPTIGGQCIPSIALHPFIGIQLLQRPHLHNSSHQRAGSELRAQAVQVGRQ